MIPPIYLANFRSYLPLKVWKKGQISHPRFFGESILTGRAPRFFNLEGWNYPIFKKILLPLNNDKIFWGERGWFCPPYPPSRAPFGAPSQFANPTSKPWVYSVTGWVISPLMKMSIRAPCWTWNGKPHFWRKCRAFFLIQKLRSCLDKKTLN